MIYHIKYLSDTEKKIKADGFDVHWNSVFAFYTTPDGITSKSVILYVPISRVLWMEPMDDEVDKELIRAKSEAALKIQNRNFLSGK